MKKSWKRCTKFHLLATWKIHCEKKRFQIPCDFTESCLNVHRRAVRVIWCPVFRCSWHRNLKIKVTVSWWCISRLGKETLHFVHLYFSTAFSSAGESGGESRYGGSPVDANLSRQGLVATEVHMVQGRGTCVGAQDLQEPVGDKT